MTAASTAGIAAAAAAGAAAAAQHTSSYRVKFERKAFLELVEIAKPRMIYHRKRMHFFAFDGFVMYTFECQDSDFKQKCSTRSSSRTRAGESDPLIPFYRRHRVLVEPIHKLLLFHDRSVCRP